jgi:sulfite reductase alpha subunit-like flavoprotein
MDMDELPNHKNLLLLCATCGEGDFPKNAATFHEELKKPGAYPENHLEGVTFSMFGLGDSSYHQFNLAAVEIAKGFEALGATKQMPVGLGNDQDEDKYDTQLEEWLPDYWKVQNAPEPVGADEIPKPTFLVQPLDPEEIMAAPHRTVLPPGGKVLKLTEAKRLTAEDYDRSIMHLEFDMGEEDLPYLLGDVLNVFSKNDPKRVASFLEFYGLDGNMQIKATPQKSVDARREAAYRRPLPIKQIFEEVVDILGRPNKHFYNFLAKFAVDPKEQTQLKLLASDDGKAEYSKLIEETVTYDEVLRMFPSAHPPLEHLISQIPCIKPRLYSIASSPRYKKGKAELCIVILDWVTPSGKAQRGLGTDYVSRLRAGDDVVCTVTSGTFNFPEDPMTPMVMAGLGTGLAPFRAFAQERQWHHDTVGKQTGPMWLFYGCRFRAKDYIYGDVLEQMAKDGVITELHVAFSRDQKEKVYVQNKINANAERVREDLLDKKGYFYLCGQAGQVELDVKNAIYEAFMTGGMTREQAEKKFEELAEEGRYCPELY